MTSPHQNVPPAPGSSLYGIEGTVRDDGEERAEGFATLQPSAGAARMRYEWHCRQGGVDLLECEVTNLGDPYEALEFLRGSDVELTMSETVALDLQETLEVGPHD